MKSLLNSALWLALGCAQLSAAADPGVLSALSAQQAREDAAILVRTMSALHPALDKYRTPEQGRLAFEHFTARASAARSPGAMYLAATELAASVRCGHTWTNVLNQQGAIRQQLLESPDKLPFTMTLVDGRWLVLGSAIAGVAEGDEIISIDGKSAPDMVAAMLPYLRADGNSDGKRLRQLGHDRADVSMMDILWPLLSPPAGPGYRIELRHADGGRATLLAKATTLAARASQLKSSRPARPAEDWRLQLTADHAVLTLPSFSLYRSKFDWRGFLQTSFAELNQKKIPALIIDIRDNEGGDGAIGLELLSYLVHAPAEYVSDQSVTTYERVPYRLARHLDTWDDSFFDRTGLVTKITSGTAAGRFSFAPNAAKKHLITPSPQRYQGKTYLLVGPENSSATFALADLAKRTGAATLVGQATGGNQRGLNGGQLAWVTLPHSGVAVDIPLLASTYQADTPDASVTPDVIVARRFDAQAAGRDQEMEAVMALLAQGRQ